VGKLAAATLGRTVVAVHPGALLRLSVGELLCLLVVLGLSVALRLVGLGTDTDVSDEGIRGVQLRLMATGFWPVREIYASQGPLSLFATYPLYVLFGADIVAARLAVATYSIAGVLVAYWIGRRLAGSLAGLAAALLIAVSPVYLENSRLALVEVPSLIPALVALALLLKYRDGGDRHWLVGSAVLLAIGVLVKPMAAMVGPAVLVLIAAPCRLVAGPGSTASSGPKPANPWRRPFIDLLVYGLIGLAVAGATVAAIGPLQVYEQLVDYRLGARALGQWTLTDNWEVVRGELGREGIGLLIAAGVGVCVLARSRPVEAGSLLGWLGGGLVLFLLYSPLRNKHIVYLLPPLAILAGVAVGQARPAVTALGRRAWPGVWGAASIAALVACLAGLPQIAEQDRRVLAARAVDDPVRFADDLRVVAAATSPGDFIVMDDAYLALLTGRLMPPHMADLSWTRILARTLTSERAKQETDRFGVRVVVVRDDHLGQMSRYLDWVDRNYVLVKSYVQRTPKRYRRVYVRSDVALPAVRAALSGGIEHPMRADLGPVAVHGYTIDRREFAPRDLFSLTLHWEALATSPPWHNAVIRLRGGDGDPAQEISFPVGDGEQMLPTWMAGRWQIQTLDVPVDRRVQPGTYTLTLAVEPSKGPTAPVRGDRGATVAASGMELELGTLKIR
jgi:hypothetical protein